MGWTAQAQVRNPQMTKELWGSLDFNSPAGLPIPFCLHGDAAPFTETDSIQIVSFRRLLTQRSVGDSQMLLAAVPKAAACKDTWNSIMECLAWSFTSLYAGKTPKKDQYGEPLEGARGKPLRRGVLWAITGDLEWFASEFNFPWSSSNLLCAYCRADQKKEGSEKPFTDCRPTALWRGSILSPKLLQEKFCGHALFKIPACSVLSIKLDVLHVLDLGVSAYLHGSVIIDIMNKCGGRSRNLALFMQHFGLSSWCPQALQLQMFKVFLQLEEKQTCCL